MEAPPSDLVWEPHLGVHIQPIGIQKCADSQPADLSGCSALSLVGGGHTCLILGSQADVFS